MLIVTSVSGGRDEFVERPESRETDVEKLETSDTAHVETQAAAR